MNRTQLNLLLLVVVGGLGAALWFGKPKEEKGPPLTSLKQDAVTRIAVEHPGKPAIRLEKIDGRWQLVEPVRAATDSFEINGILGLAELEVKSKLDAGVDRAELQLDPPQFTVTLDDTRVALGGVEPLRYNRYVQVGEVLGLVDDPPSAALDADYSDLVSRAIVPEGAELVRLELPGFVLEKDPAGNWISPQQPEAKPAQTAKLVESWKGARAMWNAAEKPEGLQGEKVRLTLADGQVIELVFAESDPQLVLARPAIGVRYTLSKALVEELFRIPAEPKPGEPEPAKAAEDEPPPTFGE